MLKFLIVLAWIFIPYIMIFVRWKKMKVIARILSVVWSIFVILMTFSFFFSPDKALVIPTTPSKHVPANIETPFPTESVKPVLSPTPTPMPSPTELAKPAPSIVVPVQTASEQKYDAVIHFPSDKYPETAHHIQEALASGETAICTIDRKGADENRKESLQGIPTKKGYDRDEFPMAMCAEGGYGADIEYVTPADNRGSGSWVGNQFDGYSDGTRVLFVIDGTYEVIPSKSPSPNPISSDNSSSSVSYANCTAVRQAGAAPLHKGDPGYSTKLDRDHDGVACEK